MPGPQSIFPVGSSVVPTAFDAQTEAEHIETAPVEKEELNFEAIERKLGVMLIFVYRDRRNLYSLLAQKVTDQYKAQIKISGDSYRKITPILLSGTSCLLQTGSLSVLLIPKLPIACQEGFNRLTNLKVDCLRVSSFCDDLGCVNFAGMPNEEVKRVMETASKAFAHSDQVIQTISKITETRDQGTKVETQAESENLRSLSEASRNEKLRYLQEEGDGLRTREQLENKRRDFEQSMTRFQS